MQNFDDVHQFHTHFELPAPNRPQFLEVETNQFRIDFMSEEFDEYVTACIDKDLAGAADALIDLVYVAMGTAVMMGLPWQQLWDAVHTANMRKQRAGQVSESKRGTTLDVVKPPGWQPPDLEVILKEYQ